MPWPKSPSAVLCPMPTGGFHSAHRSSASVPLMAVGWQHLQEITQGALPALTCPYLLEGTKITALIWEENQAEPGCCRHRWGTPGQGHRLLQLVQQGMLGEPTRPRLLCESCCLGLGQKGCCSAV